MLKYIIIPLSSDCESYCHYDVRSGCDGELIKPDMLAKIVFWAMKENLSIQFIYPRYPIPKSLGDIVESIDHIKIVHEAYADDSLLKEADVIVSRDFDITTKVAGKIYVIRTDFHTLINSAQSLKQLTLQSRKVSVVLTDIPSFVKDDISSYREFLDVMADFIADEYTNGNTPQLNLITDRMLLETMNNCNAGNESMAVSIDGTFYPCPAFIGDTLFACGSIDSGVKASGLRLYDRSNAPICKVCDAYHCKRCVWLNKRLTREVNTPGWQQCYMSHLEREASKKALEKIQAKMPNFLTGISIPHLEYLDPYSIIERL